MSSLREFLQDKGLDLHQVERRKRREEWVGAVSKLLNQLQDWLKEADPQGVLEVSRWDVEKVEQGMGAYRVPEISVVLNDSDVKIVPIGRNVVGIIGPHGVVGGRAEGRVDIMSGGRKYILYRTIQDGVDRWFAIDERYEANDLDRNKFEAIMLDLLS